MDRTENQRDLQDYLDILGYGDLVPQPAPVARLQAAARTEQRTKSLPATATAAASPTPEPAGEWKVLAHGPTQARLVFVCEAPAAPGSPEGELLGRMTQAMGVARSNVLLLEMVEGAQAQPDLASLREQLQPWLTEAAPQVVLAFGALAAGALLDKSQPLGRLRGQVWEHPQLPTRVLVTYAASLCLSNPNLKRPVWEDLQQAMKELNL